MISFLKHARKTEVLLVKPDDKEAEIGIQKSFVTQFAENQNHHQRLFIQFLSSVLIVIVAYAFVYSNTASYSGMNIHKIISKDSITEKEVIINIKSEKFDTSKFDNGAIISYSQFSLLSIYIFAQIVLLILSIMILHMGYSFRRDQSVVNRIRIVNLTEETYDKLYGRKNFYGRGKGFLEYLPNFNSILFFAICIIQGVLFFSLFTYFQDFGDGEFYKISKTILLPPYNVNYIDLRTSLIFPLLVNFFLYTYYYNKYEFTVNNLDTYVPLIKPLCDKNWVVFVYIFVILLSASLLVYCFYKVNKIVHLWTFIYFYLIILLPTIVYAFIKKRNYGITLAQLVQGITYFVCGLLLIFHAYWYFTIHDSYVRGNSKLSFALTFGSVLIFLISNWIGSFISKSEETTLPKYLKEYNRFLFVLLYLFVLVSILELKWLDYLVATFFGIYSVLIGRRTTIKWRQGEYDDKFPASVDVSVK